MDTYEDAVSEVLKKTVQRRPLGSSLPGLDGAQILDTFPPEEDLQSTFHEIWGALEEHLDLSLTSVEAAKLFPSLVIYDMPDGTRSTLTVMPDIDVGVDTGLYCIAAIHTLKGLGVRDCVMMTHTSYNRMRGEEGIGRILRIISRSTKDLHGYLERNRVDVNLVGLRKGYELEGQLRDALPSYEKPSFRAHFLVDYAEELIHDRNVRNQIMNLPDVDVCIRHTKFNMFGGWIPGKLLTSAFIYSQNGTLFSNWSFDELVAMSTLALLAKLLHTGEGLAKMYGDIDEVKRRYQLRELKLFNKRIELREPPRKLFVLGSHFGLYQFYY